MEKNGRRLEAEVARLEVERTSLLLELKASKDEVSSFHSQAGKPWSRFSLMATDVACSNTTSVTTSKGFRMACLTLPTHFLQSFFVNLRCPPAPTTIVAKAAEVHLGEEAKDPVEVVVAEEQG